MIHSRLLDQLDHRQTIAHEASSINVPKTQSPLPPFERTCWELKFSETSPICGHVAATSRCDPSKPSPISKQLLTHKIESSSVDPSKTTPISHHIAFAGIDVPWSLRLLGFPPCRPCASCLLPYPLSGKLLYTPLNTPSRDASFTCAPHIHFRDLAERGR